MSSEANTRTPLLVVISGPSGVGKDAVLEKLRATHPELFFAVTATTRPKRPGEVDDVDYIFVTPNRFHQLEERGELLEHAEVYGNFYGVPKGPLRRAIAEGKDAIVKVDVQGAATIKKMAPEAFLIFLAAPSMEELERRLTARKADSPEQMAIRIATARDEMTQSARFDAIVVNGTNSLEEAVEEIVEVIREQRARSSRKPVGL
ncbi:MAG: guanylate kinase [Chloroflexi bacterium]|nr:guanylate kinase [Chloroflexota bacterium]